MLQINFIVWIANNNKNHSYWNKEIGFQGSLSKIISEWQYKHRLFDL
jgi:hypothetical protein